MSHPPVDPTAGAIHFVGGEK
ncbi:MAG: hypothetical protein RJA36_550, partial [Pseudomonadota bacterium]